MQNILGGVPTAPPLSTFNQQTINALTAANQALQTELNQLKTDYNQLKQDYDRVQAENKQFRNDIERMKFDIRLLLIKLNLYKKPPHRNDGKLVNIDQNNDE